MAWATQGTTAWGCGNLSSSSNKHSKSGKYHKARRAKYTKREGAERQQNSRDRREEDRRDEENLDERLADGFEMLSEDDKDDPPHNELTSQWD